MDVNTITPPQDPRVPKVKRLVLMLAGLVVASLITAATLATIHLATDRPAKEVLGFGKGEE